jgi:hypothetical protein
MQTSSSKKIIFSVGAAIMAAIIFGALYIVGSFANIDTSGKPGTGELITFSVICLLVFLSTLREIWFKKAK